MMNKFHQFHMVELSPWPILVSTSVMSTMLSMVSWTQMKSMYPMIISILITATISYSWWRDMIRESKNQGMHFNKMMKGMKMGMILFILSEVLFFVSFFWAFFHCSSSPNIEMGQKWPPMGIQSFNPMNIPLLNTIILLSSGISITWAHHSMMINNKKWSSSSMNITIMLGLYFTMLQAMEYWQAEFSMADSIYGSTFFMATGFHGLHVIIGTTFLMICLKRIKTMHLSMNHMMGFEMSAWYWHFVDVVWIMLYSTIYWWGS